MTVTSTNSNKSWTEFFTETAYSTASAVALKTQQVWDMAPQPIKSSVETWSNASPLVRIPVKAAAIYFVPGGLLVQGAAAVAAIWSETPTEVVGVVTGHPINMMGHRLALTDGTEASALNEEEPLDRLSAKIEQCEAISNKKNNSAPADTPLTPAQLEAKTNKNLETLIQKISSYSTLYTLHSYICNIEEENSYDSLLSLVASASKLTADGKQPSLWKLFYKKYKNRLSFPQVVKAGLFYFFCNYIPIIPNTIDAYMKNLLGVVRDKLKKDSVSRNQFIQQTISDNERLLGVINGAIRKFAKGEPLIDSSGRPIAGLPLQDYILDAIDQLVGISDQELAPKFTNALIDQYPTRIPFEFGETILNWIIPRILKKWVLPNVTASLIQKSNQQLKQNGAVPVLVPGQNGTQNTEQRLRFHTPFFLALTETLVDQMKVLAQKLEEERKKDPEVGSPPASEASIDLIGAEGLPGLIANLIEAIHLSGPAKIRGEAHAADTIKDVAARIKKLEEETPDELDTKIKAGIQTGLVEGTHFLLNYLADPNNTEDMFAKLLGLLDGPFCREEPKTELEWKREKNTYEDSKKQLRKISKEIFNGIIDSAVEKAAGNTPPERTEAVAKAIFAEHKQNGLSSFQQLQTSLSQIERKLASTEETWTQEKSLHTEIDEICATLKDFKNMEEIEEQINKLSLAEQESIRRILLPIYEGADQIMEATLSLQQTEIEYAPNARNVDRFNKIKEELLQLDQADIKISASKMVIEKIQAQLKKLEKSPSLPVEELLDLSRELSAKAASIESEQTSLADVQQLKLLSRGLISSINNPSIPFNRKKSIPEIKKIIKRIIPADSDQTRLLTIMDQINRWDRNSSPLKELTQPLLDELNQLEALQKEKIGSLFLEFNEKRKAFTTLVERHEARLKDKKKKDALRLKHIMQNIQTTASTLHTMIQGAEKESQIQLRSENSKMILGSLGALLGMGISLALRRVAPVYAAPAITGFLATGLYHSTELFSGNSSTRINTVGKMMAGAGVSAGAAVAAASVLPATAALPILTMVQSRWLGTAAASVVERNIEIPKNQAKAKAIAQVTEIFDKAYDNILTSSSFYEGNRRLFMKGFTQTARV